MKPTILLAAVALLTASAAEAQYSNPYGVVAGSRVRITAPTLADQPLVGRLVAAGGDSLVLLANTSAATVRMPSTAVQGVAVSDGRDRAGSALRYGAVGALVGGVVTGVAVARDEPLAGFVGFVAGVVVGAPIGALAGAIVAPEHWRELIVQPPASPSTTAGTTGYRLSIEPGTEVRLVRRATPERTANATVAEMSGDTLVLGGRGVEDLRRIPISDLARLDVRGGKDRRRGILYGAAALGLVTGVAGGVDYSHHNISGGDFIGTTIGNMVLGGLIGYAFSPTGWEPLALPRR